MTLSGSPDSIANEASAIFKSRPLELQRMRGLGRSGRDWCD